MKLASFVIALVGCTHHRPLAQVGEVEGEVSVEVSGARTVDAVAVADGLGVSFVAKDGGAIASEHVTRVVDRRHGRGAAEGLGLGALAGVVTGVILGYSSGDDECNEDQWCILTFSAEEKAVLAGFGLGVLGAGLGLVVGAVKGSTIIYENAETGVVVRPSGNGVAVTF